MTNPSDIFISIPSASSDGLYHGRYPHGDAPSGAILQGAASDTTSASGVLDPAIAISGNQFVLSGATQARGYNISGYEASAILGSNGGTDASGGNWNFDQAHGPNTSVLKTSKPNIIRIPLNEASWLGYNCYDINGTEHTGTTLNCNGTYQSQIDTQIAALNAINCCVILDLHFSNPGRSAPIGQDFMANQDNSVQFWQSVANRYGYPNGTALKRNGGSVADRSVVFELFNEPFLYGGSDWSLLMNGGFWNAYYQGDPADGYAAIYPYPVTSTTGTFTPGESFTSSAPSGITGKVHCYYQNTTTGLASSGTKFLHLRNISGSGFTANTVITGSTSGATATLTSGTYGWYVAGHAQLLAAIRATGAQNPCLLSGLGYSGDLSNWAANAPSDSTAPAGFTGTWVPQIAAVQHIYPPVCWITAISPSAGGSGYAVNDTILLPMPESGANANSVYWQAQAKVTSVGAGGSITGLSLQAYTGGTPGAAGGNPNSNSYPSFNGMVGGIYYAGMLPSNPVSPYSTSGSGAGATFNLTFSSPSTSYSFANIMSIMGTSPGCPVIITETGEHSGTGVSGSPYMGVLTQFCDGAGSLNTLGVKLGLVLWSYNPGGGWVSAAGQDDGIITAADAFTPGYGQFIETWMSTHAP